MAFLQPIRIHAVSTGGVAYPATTCTETVSTITVSTITDSVVTSTVETVLLCHFEGDDGTTTIIDSSTTGHTMVANGDAQIDTAQKTFGSASLLLDGTGDYVSSADHADWDFGSGDFSIDAWIRFNTVSVNTYTILSQATDSDNHYRMYVRMSSAGSGKLNFDAFDNGSSIVVCSSSATAWAVNTWYHVNASKNNNIVRVTKNTTCIGSSSGVTGTIPDFPAELYIGRHLTSDDFNGWIDELTVVKGGSIW
jgi:hypothetical protein